MKHFQMWVPAQSPLHYISNVKLVRVSWIYADFTNFNNICRFTFHTYRLPGRKLFKKYAVHFCSRNCLPLFPQKEFMMELTAHQSSVGNVLQAGNQLIAQGNLTEEEEDEIREQMCLLNSRWECLRVASMERQARWIHAL